MKKFICLLLFFSILTACINSDDPSSELDQIEREITSEEIIVHPNKEDAIIDEQGEEKIENENMKETKESEKIVPLYKINTKNWSIEPISDAPKNIVLLTVDDAPDQYGDEMARILNSLGVKAIFFVNGHFLKNETGRKQLQEIAQLGHEIGNHTMNHPNLSKLSEEEQRKEIVELNNLVEEIIGKRPRFFRAPFGVNTEVSRTVVTEEGMQMMNWSYGYDYFKEYMEKDALINIMVNAPELRNGANLLLHDRKFTMEALEEIVKGLQNKGYSIVDPIYIK